MTRGVAPWLLLLAIVACGQPAPVATSAAPPATAAPVQAPADARPALTTTPTVNLTVGVAPNSVFGPHYIAQARGYFQEVGLNVEFFVTPGPSEQLPALIQGQIQVGGCASNIGCFNALNRRADVQIVADLQSCGKTLKSTGNIALVVRKDLWDDGTIREPKHLLGRTVYTSGGQGVAPY